MVGEVKMKSVEKQISPGLTGNKSLGLLDITKILVAHTVNGCWAPSNQCHRSPKANLLAVLCIFCLL